MLSQQFLICSVKKSYFYYQESCFWYMFWAYLPLHRPNFTQNSITYTHLYPTFAWFWPSLVCSHLKWLLSNVKSVFDIFGQKFLLLLSRKLFRTHVLGLFTFKSTQFHTKLNNLHSFVSNLCVILTEFGMFSLKMTFEWC